ncbi:uncharacterized protein LOC110816203 [Carica papaya]|uniref:uncharacterized protein LOC110816203 n=1 Tax=Carica papaya TaxID=3649 RepID=UPI000B8CB889|nr:uncharacterized protein LOC110816203 [Carica papaya]
MKREAEKEERKGKRNERKGKRKRVAERKEGKPRTVAQGEKREKESWRRKKKKRNHDRGALCDGKIQSRAAHVDVQKIAREPWGWLRGDNWEPSQGRITRIEEKNEELAPLLNE